MVAECSNKGIRARNKRFASFVPFTLLQILNEVSLRLNK